MNKLITALVDLYAKERFFVMQAVFGLKTPVLSAQMRRQICDQLKLEIPHNNHVFLDYHLDWVVAALTAGLRRGKTVTYENTGKATVHGNQEDIDAVIAFELDGRTHLLFVEAKGVGGWNNRQLNSKVERLKTIFDESHSEHGHVIPHFALLSPHKSEHLKIDTWPAWILRSGKPVFFKLELRSTIWAGERCSEEGIRARDKGYWHVIERRIPNA